MGCIQDTPGYTASEQHIRGLTWGPLEGLWSLLFPHTLLRMWPCPGGKQAKAAVGAQLWRGTHSQVHASANPTSGWTQGWMPPKILHPMCLTCLILILTLPWGQALEQCLCFKVSIYTDVRGRSYKTFMWFLFFNLEHGSIGELADMSQKSEKGELNLFCSSRNDSLGKQIHQIYQAVL